MPDEYNDNCESGDGDGEDEEGVGQGHEYEEGEYECLQCKGNHYDDGDCGANDSDEDSVDIEDEGGVLDVDVDVDEMLARLGKWESDGNNGQQGNCHEKPEKLLLAPR